MTSPYVTPQKMIYPKPIIVFRSGWNVDDAQNGIARSFGLTAKDFIWISTAHGWPNRISGRSRGLLVLDPENMVSHPKPEIEAFAQTIMLSFNRVISAPNCQSSLEAWLKAKDPPMYRRMIGEDESNIGIGDQQEMTPHAG